MFKAFLGVPVLLLESWLSLFQVDKIAASVNSYMFFKEIAGVPIVPFLEALHFHGSFFSVSSKAILSEGASYKKAF